MPDILIQIMAIWLLINLLVKLFDVTVQRVKGYRWWYRNIYLWSPHWRTVRGLKLFLSGYRCKQCGTRKWLDVHHKSYKYMHMEWIALWSLEVLCRQHHVQEHSGR